MPKEEKWRSGECQGKKTVPKLHQENIIIDSFTFKEKITGCEVANRGGDENSMGDVHGEVLITACLAKCGAFFGVA